MNTKSARKRSLKLPPEDLSGLVSLGRALELAMQFDSSHFLIPVNSTLPTASQAKTLGIVGDERIFSDTNIHLDVFSLKPFELFEVVENILVSKFVNQDWAKMLHRPANRKEHVSFIEKYPSEMQRGRFVCINSGIISDSRDGHALVYFEQKTQGFRASIESKDKMLYPGDVIIMKKWGKDGVPLLRRRLKTTKVK